MGPAGALSFSQGAIMKKLFPLSLIAGLILTSMCVGTAPKADAQSAGVVSSILRRMERANQSLKTLSADIGMWKYNAQIREEDSYAGVVKYVRVLGGNGFVYLEWNKPRREILTVANGNYQLYKP